MSRAKTVDDSFLRLAYRQNRCGGCATTRCGHCPQKAVKIGVLEPSPDGFSIQDAGGQSSACPALEWIKSFLKFLLIQTLSNLWIDSFLRMPESRSKFSCRIWHQLVRFSQRFISPWGGQTPTHGGFAILGDLADRAYGSAVAMVSGVFTCSTMQRNCAPMATRNRRIGTSGMVVYCLTQLGPSAAPRQNVLRDDRQRPGSARHERRVKEYGDR